MDQKISAFRELPGWDQEFIVPRMEIQTAGTAVNVAYPLARLGVGTGIIGCVGEDADGRRIIAEAAAAGIDTAGIDTVPGMTGISTLLISENGEYSCITYLGSSERLDREMVLNHFDLVSDSDFVFFTGYFLSPGLAYEDVRFLMEKAKGENKTVLFETGKDPYGWKDRTIREIRDLLRYVDYFIPSLIEASALSRKDTPEGIAEDLRKCGAGTVVITLNDKGCVTASRDGIHHAPAVLPAKIADTLGAGDCFDAGFVYGLTQHWELEKIMQFCNTLCSVFISRQTDRYPTAEEIIKAMP